MSILNPSGFIPDDKFWAKVNRTDKCWFWMGAKMKNGYGILTRGGSNQTAHRRAYELVHGKIPDGMCVLHRCDVRNCVRPDHLFRGTKLDNVRDMFAKGRNPKRDNAGTRNPSVKLSDDQVRDIRSDKRILRIVAEKYGVTTTTVHAIRQRKTWTHL